MSDETENLSTTGDLPERVTEEASSTPAVESSSATPPPPPPAGLDDAQKRALFRAVHALARRVAQKERNARSRAARGIAPAVARDLNPQHGDTQR